MEKGLLFSSDNKTTKFVNGRKRTTLCESVLNNDQLYYFLNFIEEDQKSSNKIKQEIKNIRLGNVSCICR